MKKISLLGLFACIFSMAAFADSNVFLPVVGGLDAIKQMKGVYQAVQFDKSVQNLLSKNNFSALSVSQKIDDQELQTVKFQQYFKGLEVVGGKAFHHQSMKGATVVADLAQFDLDTNPSFVESEAVSIARSVVSDDQTLQSMPVLKVFPARDGSARLIYWVKTHGEDIDSGRDVLIDAHSGQVIGNLTRNLDIAPVHVYTTTLNGQEIDGCQRVNSQGRPTSINLNSCSRVVTGGGGGSQADQSARQAAANARMALEYYQNSHNRNSFDNRGSNVVSLVHIGKKFANAFWSGDLKVMAYGDGDGKRFGDFTQAVDVAGHEMTHGVVSETANLIYMDESGALNEGFADFFGKMIANDGEWVIGRKIFITPSTKGIRDLKTPSNNGVCVEQNDLGQCTKIKPYPAKVAEQFPSSDTCDSDNDYCWVHVNSTIPGHAAYLINQAIGKAKAEKLMYLVLTHYLSERSDFSIFASETKRACMQTMDSGTCDKVNDAFTEVGL